MTTIFYVGHCFYTDKGTDTDPEMDYEYALDTNPGYTNNLNWYGIAVTQIDGANRTVTAAIIVKSDMGTSKEEVGEMYSAVVHNLPSLASLPKSQVALNIVKFDVPLGKTVNKNTLLDIFGKLYTSISRKGSA